MMALPKRKQKIDTSCIQKLRNKYFNNERYNVFGFSLMLLLLCQPYDYFSQKIIDYISNQCHKDCESISNTFVH